MTESKVSLIIPVYKVENYIRRCLDSVMSQTYKNLEIILIDNGSPDECPQICDEYAAKDKRFTVIHLKNNVGVSAARNYGIEASSGDWLMFIDSDDWIESDFIENLIASLPNSETDILYAGGLYFDYGSYQNIAYSFEKKMFCENGTEKDYFISKTLSPAFGFEKKVEFFATIAGPWNKFYRTSFLKENNLRFIENLQPNEDVLFNLLAIKKSCILASSLSIGYHYMQIMNSALHRFNAHWLDMSETVLDALNDVLNDYSDNEIVRSAVEVRTIVYLSQCLKNYFFHPDNHEPYLKKAAQFIEFKKIPLIKETIFSPSDKGLSIKQKIIKRLMRLPFSFPVMFTVLVDYKTRKRN